MISCMIGSHLESFGKTDAQMTSPLTAFTYLSYKTISFHVGLVSLHKWILLHISLHVSLHIFQLQWALICIFNAVGPIKMLDYLSFILSSLLTKELFTQLSDPCPKLWEVLYLRSHFEVLEFFVQLYVQENMNVQFWHYWWLVGFFICLFFAPSFRCLLFMVPNFHFYRMISVAY